MVVMTRRTARGAVADKEKQMMVADWSRGEARVQRFKVKLGLGFHFCAH